MGGAGDAFWMEPSVFAVALKPEGHFNVEAFIIYDFFLPQMLKKVCIFDSFIVLDALAVKYYYQV